MATNQHGMHMSVQERKEAKTMKSLKICGIIEICYSAISLLGLIILVITGMGGTIGIVVTWTTLIISVIPASMILTAGILVACCNGTKSRSRLIGHLVLTLLASIFYGGELILMVIGFAGLEAIEEQNPEMDNRIGSVGIPVMLVGLVIYAAVFILLCVSCHLSVKLTGCCCSPKPTSAQFVPLRQGNNPPMMVIAHPSANGTVWQPVQNYPAVNGQTNPLNDGQSGKTERNLPSYDQSLSDEELINIANDQTTKDTAGLIKA